MAGTTVATWVKVKTKTGMTSRPISHKYEGGAGYEHGQVITQSEYQKLKAEGNQKREDGKSGGKLADNVRTVKAEVVTDAPRRGRLSQLLDEMDQQDRQDIKGTAKMLGIAADRVQKIESNLGSKPTEINSKPSLSPVTQPKTGGSRWGNLISELDDIDKRDTENFKQMAVATKKLIDLAYETGTQSNKKSLSQSGDRPALKPSKKTKKK